MVKFKPSALMATVATVLFYLGVGQSTDPPPTTPTPSPGNTARDQPPAKTPAPGERPNATAGAEPAGAVPGVPFRTANFEVHAPTAVLARVLASEAEYHRKELALKWLGRELPAWSNRCVIRYSQGLGGDNGTTTFTFGTNKGGDPIMTSAQSELRGNFMRALTTVLPHDVMHTVLAAYFAKPLPRWADEGVAILAESDTDQDAQDVLCRKLLDAGRGIRLNTLLRMKEYPRDLLALYAQGHSVARFLVSPSAPAGTKELKDLPHIGELFKTGANPHRRLVAFIHLGAEENTTESWAQAAKDVYGFKSVDDLEEAWLAWLKKSAGAVKAKESEAPVLPKDKPDSGDSLPPVPYPARPEPGSTAPSKIPPSP